MIRDWYYYYQLNPNCRILYQRVLDGVLKRQTSVDCRGLHIGIDDYSKVYSAVEYDNPHLYYVDYYRRRFIENKGLLEQVLIDYLYSPDDTETLNALINKSVRVILAKVGVSSTDEYEKVKRIHDFFANHVVYNQSVLEGKKESFEWFRAQSILGVFLDKSAICSGISMSMKYIMNCVGIRAIVVPGTAKAGNSETYEPHAWNIIKINGENYHLDMTWDMSCTESGLISYNFFNLDDSLIKRDHVADVKTPVCNSMSLNYFEQHGSVIRSSRDLQNYLSQIKYQKPVDFYARFDNNSDLLKEAQYVERYIANVIYANRRVSVKEEIDTHQRIVRCTVI